ncbi:RagB/SusD family nutrient uptake outer membrane protein [Parapedobacter tibetensis]|uniref:RagB/SusD family nutrient uptake outer membrane protein n=1 Tax=Parapedobacter tibetensis TaxID=2972951 RepID=UPI00214D7349|nr:RagB/SusD family nutrient uptake outer membrane protein [Parapedobacter tibetensis]
MKTINMIWIVLLIVVCSSCEGFLDVEPSNAGDANTSIKTAADAQVVINGLMRRMTHQYYYGRNFVMYGDAKGGDLTIFSQGRGLDALYTFNHTQSANNYGTYWSHLYEGILQMNNLLENIEKLEQEGTIEDFDNAKGRALTARALIYFDLVRLYGKAYTDDKASYGVPNVTEPLEDTAQPLRASVEENYMQILADLTTAAPLLSKQKSNGYMNYYANKALQARVHLYMGHHAEALSAAEEIINDGVYSLYANNAWVDSWKTQFGTESIFELGIFPNEGDLGSGSLGFYLRRRGDSPTAAGWFMASDYFLDRLGEDEDDVRWGVMAQDESETPRLGSCYKYSGSVALEGDGKPENSTAVNIKVIRLSEIYLIAAEAALPTNPAAAAGYLNEIRKRSPNLLPATAATITLDMILDERGKELFAEGHRFFDMIRLNKSITFNDDFAGISIPHREKTIDRSFYKTILPISQGEIDANPGIESQQNPGY